MVSCLNLVAPRRDHGQLRITFQFNFGAPDLPGTNRQFHDLVSILISKWEDVPLSHRWLDWELNGLSFGGRASSYQAYRFEESYLSGNARRYQLTLMRTGFSSVRSRQTRPSFIVAGYHNIWETIKTLFITCGCHSSLWQQATTIEVSEDLVISKPW